MNRSHHQPFLQTGVWGACYGDDRADTGGCGGEGGLLVDQHRGGCPAAGSRAVLSAIDVIRGWAKRLCEINERLSLPVTMHLHANNLGHL